MNIIIRTDASFDIGSGHLMRSLVLAEALKKSNHEVQFVCVDFERSFLNRVGENGYLLKMMSKELMRGSFNDADFTVNEAKSYKASWIICDGYVFGKSYQRQLVQAGFKVLCIDDMATDEILADAVLNQNFGVTKDEYKCAAGTAFFLGPEFALVRAEFYAKAVGFNRIYSKRATKILITMGGADPHGVTKKVLEALTVINRNDLDIRIILGGMNKDEAVIKSFAATMNSTVNIYKDLRHEMVDMMKWADMAISSGGSILWEYAHVGCPVMTVVLAENQENIVKHLSAHKAIESVGYFNKDNAGIWGSKINALIEDQPRRTVLGQHLQSLVQHNRINEVILHMESKI